MISHVGWQNLVKFFFLFLTPLAYYLCSIIIACYYHVHDALGISLLSGIVWKRIVATKILKCS